jgi:hypothetical protein
MLLFVCGEEIQPKQTKVWENTFKRSKTGDFRRFHALTVKIFELKFRKQAISVDYRVISQNSFEMLLHFSEKPTRRKLLINI